MVNTTRNGSNVKLDDVYWILDLLALLCSLLCCLDPTPKLILTQFQRSSAVFVGKVRVAHKHG
ncbi:hypothetical protein C1H46_001892 [Malus baccata]|uniref:Uncharacterized protein n=1 Tax=Malus baccata TaxID=106549 RepID=A0A540NNB2_MALBA|nr:hypothetical protein C1H46_001892 [Malus baccata]